MGWFSAAVTGSGDSEISQQRDAFSYLAEHGDEILLAFMLELRQHMLDSKDKDGRTPLSHAARKGHEAVVKLLRETTNIKANNNLKDRNGRTPLLYAAMNGYKAVVKLLLETGQVKADLKD